MKTETDQLPGSTAQEHLGGDSGEQPGATDAASTTEDAEPLETPGQWLERKFPGLSEKHGAPLRTQANAEGHERVVDINEDFFAATLGMEGDPEQPAVFLPKEGRFYRYVNNPDDPNHGTFIEVAEEVLAERISKLLLECARESESGVDVTNLEFSLRTGRKLKGVIEKAKSILMVPDDFFERGRLEHLACANGMLRLADMVLVPFSPAFHCRHKLAVPYIEGAICPMFLELLIRPALHAEDIDLVQRWMGLAISGVNMAQVILLLIGTAGGGKGTLVRVITGILGARQVAALRVSLLTSRFELGRCLGRSLLYGADVKANFLNQEGASVLKSVTGGDPVTVELKNSNASIETVCRFNVLLTSNSRLKVRLEGDDAAWRRRLLIISFENDPPAKVIADLSERIVAEEGAGVLNFMLEGLAKLRAEGWQIPLNGQQQRRVDDLLSESDSVRQFVQEKVVAVEGQPLTVERAFAAYLGYCGKRRWSPLSHAQFGKAVADVVAELFHLAVRHDVADMAGHDQRGWKGVTIK